MRRLLTALLLLGPAGALAAPAVAWAGDDHEPLAARNRVMEVARDILAPFHIVTRTEAGFFGWGRRITEKFLVTHARMAALYALYPDVRAAIDDLGSDVPSSRWVELRKEFAGEADALLGERGTIMDDVPGRHLTAYTAAVLLDVLIAERCLRKRTCDPGAVARLLDDRLLASESRPAGGIDAEREDGRDAGTSPWDTAPAREPEPGMLAGEALGADDFYAALRRKESGVRLHKGAGWMRWGGWIGVGLGLIVGALVFLDCGSLAPPCGSYFAVAGTAVGVGAGVVIGSYVLDAAAYRKVDAAAEWLRRPVVTDPVLLGAR